jgi:NitT/TauT family transport system permease protein
VGRSSETLAAPLDAEAALRVQESERVRRAVARDGALVFGGQMIMLVVLLVGWWAASGTLVDSLFVSDPLSIGRSFLRLLKNGVLWSNLQLTLVEMALGYVIGAVLGIGVALVVSQVPMGEPVARPFMLAGYATPKVALAPIIIIWFGIQLLPKVVLAAALVMFPVYFNTLAGIASVSPLLVNIVRVMGAGRFTLLTNIVLPSAAPYIFAALHITLPAALIGALIGEFLSSNRGIGYLISAASSRYDTAEVFAGILALLVVVLIMNSVVSALERRAMHWRPAAFKELARR